MYFLMPSIFTRGPLWLISASPLSVPESSDPAEGFAHIQGKVY